MADLSCITVDGNPGEYKKDDIEIKCVYFKGFTLSIDNYAFINNNKSIISIRELYYVKLR